MNLESQPSKKSKPAVPQDDLSMEDFDFKPITSGLGFHQPKVADVKPVFTDKTIPSSAPIMQNHPLNTVKEMNVYQNDLSLFYGQTNTTNTAAERTVPEISEEKYYRLASASQRITAYFLDLLFLTGVVGIMLTVMARTISMDLLEVWQAYPNEITPLVITIFCGFYFIYFSIFEKAPHASVGKNMLGLRVVDANDKGLSFATLLLRTFVTLVNFVSLGLFSYFDLQNKITHSKVIRID